jgi:putative ABC transport system permease protein
VPAVRALRLALRGLGWRRGQSLLLVSVAAAAGLCAALGPIWARAAEASLLGQRLAGAPTRESGFVQEASRHFDLTADDVLGGLEKASRDPGLDAWFGPASVGARLPNGVVRVGGRQVAIVGVGWYAHGCAAIKLVVGRCPDALGEVVVPVAARRVGLRLGGVYPVELSDTGPAEDLRVVGVYDRPALDAAAWAGSDPFDGSPSAVGALDRLDTFLVTRSTMVGTDNAEFRAYALRPLRRDRVGLDDVEALARFAGAAQLVEDRTGTGVVGRTGLPLLLREIAGDRGVLRTTVRAVTVQLVLLADFVLFLVLAASTGERAREVALAKLRGMRPGGTVVFGLAEPVLLLLVGLPLGAAASVVVDRALAAQVLRPGTGVVLTEEAMVGLLLAGVGGLIACALAARRAFTTSVLGELRGAASGSRRTLGSAVLDAVVITAAAAAAYEMPRGGSDGLSLLAPGLAALAAGLLVVRGVPAASRSLEGLTRRSRHVAAFLAVRQVARAPAGLRVVVLLAVASALAIFTVDSTVIAARNRAERARIEVGAARVLRLGQSTPGEVLAAVSRVDPRGDWAMAALTSGSASNLTGTMLAVDAARLARITQWRPSWSVLPASQLADALRPAAAPVVTVHDRLRVTIVAHDLPVEPPAVLVDVRDRRGARLLVDAGLLRAGRHDYVAGLGECTLGCRLTGLHFPSPSIGQAAIGTAVLERVADRTGVVDAGLRTAGRWRPAPGSRRDVAVPPAATIRLTGAGLEVSLNGGATDDPAVEVADHPAAVPALVAPSSDPRRRTSVRRPEAPGLGLDGSTITLRLLPAVTVLPVVAGSGALVDLVVADRADVLPPIGADYQVWLGPRAPPDAVDRVRAAGLTVTREQSLAQRQAVLDRDGVSLALMVFRVATVVALVLAVAAVGSAGYAAARRRGYELAAVRTLGASRRQLVASLRLEQLVMLVLGLAVGTATSLATAHWALPAVPSLGTGRSGIPASFAPAWPQLSLLVLGVLALCLLTAEVLARLVVAGAGPDRLREGAP